jgi:hypothetical protein
MQKNKIFTVGAVLLVLGVVGLVSNFSVFLMWGLVIVGLVVLFFGWLDNDKNVGGKK